MDDVLAYIKEQKSQGFSNEQIKQVMIQNGYQPDTVNQYFSKLQTTNQPRKGYQNQQINQDFGKIPQSKFGRSWYLTKATFKILWSDKKLVGMVFLGLILDIIIVAAAIATLFIAPDTQAFFYVYIAALYFAFAFTATYVNAAIAYAVREKVSKNKKPSFMEMIGFCTKRLGRIIQWSLIAALVGILFKILENALRKSPLGEIGRKIIMSILGLAWSIASLFVVPSMVLRDVGPIQGFKDTVSTLKKTWGESIILYTGFGLMKSGVVITFTILMILTGFFMFTTEVSIIATVISLSILGLLFIFVLMLFKAAELIFNTSIYLFAINMDKVPFFPRSLMKNSIRKR